MGIEVSPFFGLIRAGLYPPGDPDDLFAIPIPKAVNICVGFQHNFIGLEKDIDKNECMIVVLLGKE